MSNREIEEPDLSPGQIWEHPDGERYVIVKVEAGKLAAVSLENWVVWIFPSRIGGADGIDSVVYGLKPTDCRIADVVCECGKEEE